MEKITLTEDNLKYWHSKATGKIKKKNESKIHFIIY
jgi:hypothetical protein